MSEDVSGDLSEDASSDAPDDDTPTVPPSEWLPGAVMDPLPARTTLRPLPGGGVGDPVVTSNNPESLEGEGLLYGTAAASPTRGGAPLALTGRFGAYLHHFNRSATAQYVSLVVVSAHATDITVDARGAGYTQDEAGGIDLGSSPDYRVSEDWITDRSNATLPTTLVRPGGAVIVFQRLLGINREVDARLAIRASGDVHVLVVASSSGTLPSVLAAAQSGHAPGNIAVSGTPPPPYGREAGVYAHDTWRGTIDARVPTAGRHVGFMVNTATGTGLSQVQAFRALTNYSDSARESVGMYGNVYDLTVRLTHDGEGTATRRVRVSFASYVTAPLSRYWDGAALIDGALTTLRNTPDARLDVLQEVTVAPGATRTVSFRAMVPGLVSIPQAIFLESL